MGKQKKVINFCRVQENTIKKVLVNYYKMQYFLMISWCGFLGDRQGKLIN